MRHSSNSRQATEARLGHFASFKQRNASKGIIRYVLGEIVKSYSEPSELERLLMQHGYDVPAEQKEALHRITRKFGEDHKKAKQPQGIQAPVRYIKEQMKNDLTRRVFEILLLQFKQKVLVEIDLPSSCMRKMKNPLLYLARTTKLLEKIQACEVSQTSDSFFQGLDSQFG